MKITRFKFNQRIFVILFFTSIFSFLFSVYGQQHKISTSLFPPSEKIYVSTDKPYYSAGENIWCKAFLVDESSLIPNCRSQFVYVELANRFDSVCSRIKLKKDSTGFSGHIKLSPQLQEGYYEIRAFSKWMLNFSQDFIFRKQVYIGNDLNKKIICKTKYTLSSEGKYVVNCRFSDVFDFPEKDIKIKVQPINIQQPGKARQYTTDADGNIRFEIDTTSIPKSILLSANTDGLNFRHREIVPEFKKDFDIQFFPESGVLLADEVQTIAFKAIGNDGLSAEVSGQIFDNDNREITTIKSINNGMGKFGLQPQAGKLYYAVVRSESGKSKTVQLPAVQTTGIALKILFNRNGEIMYQVINHSSTINDSLVLVARSREKFLFALPLQRPVGKIAENTLPEGIISFSVMSVKGTIFCERLCFSRNFRHPVCQMTSDKKFYSKRAPVNLDFNILSCSGKPFLGNLCASVTDMELVQQDSLSVNIRSGLLLTTDLKGYIETPEIYFADNSMLTREKTDILMLTQGWRKYHQSNLSPDNKPKYFLEQGQFISGKVINIVNKPAKNINVTAVIPGQKVFNSAKTDDNGQFLLEGMDFIDSTDIYLRAFSKNRFIDVQIYPDSDYFPPITSQIFVKQDTVNQTSKNYFQAVKEKFYSEGGILHVDLNEFTVQASTQKHEPLNIYSSLADNIISEGQLKEMPGATLLSILLTFPGVVPAGNGVSIRGQGTPLFLLDGNQVEFDELTYINTSDIAEIALIKGSGTTFLGTKAMNGAISVTLKRGDIAHKAPLISMTHLKPLGYQKPEKFYVPKYDVDSIRQSNTSDLRTTIYWNPSIKTDSAGNFKLNFYTADKAHNYRLIIEGVSNDGEICRFTDVIKRENN
ncbi:MAG: TonB-dependent receptor plug domain-containing protein [Paludibacter sp.]|nr:TonB-dependent receptor plug domain-containing protein [Paludibacter sp.]